MAKVEKNELILNSSFEEMERLESFIDELGLSLNIDDDDLNRIMLVLSEAVNNAIVHGNKQKPEKKVFITTTLMEQALIITIKDEGEGFDPETLDNPLKEQNLLKEGGRGVYLIKHYADEVEFSKGGKELTVHFNLL